MESIFIMLTTALIVMFNCIPRGRTGSLFCGLVGFSGVKNADINKLKVLFAINSLSRGEDSTGYYTPNNGLKKSGDKAFKAFGEDLFKTYNADNNFIGHVRKSSVGLANERNAHPFEFKNIVGAHNGTLTNYHTMSNNNGLKSADWNVDSEVLLQVLDNNFENPADYFKALEEYEGAAALLFFHKERNTIFACRDAKRPLYYGFDSRKGMYISSMEEALLLIQCKDIKQFEENIVYEIINGKIINEVAYTPGKLVKKVSYSTSFKNVVKAFQLSALKQDIFFNRIGDVVSHNLKPDSITGFINIFGDVEEMFPFFTDYNMRLEVAVTNFNCNGNYELIKTLSSKNAVRVIEVYKNTANTIFCRFEFENAEYELPAYMFNSRNFIPIKDNYVTLLDDIWLVQGGKQVGECDDVCKVISYDLVTRTVKVYNPYYDELFHLKASHVVVSTETEISDMLAVCKDVEEREEIITEIITLNDPKDIEIIEEDEEEPLIIEWLNSQLVFEQFENIAGSLNDILEEIEANPKAAKESIDLLKYHVEELTVEELKIN